MILRSATALTVSRGLRSSEGSSALNPIFSTLPLKEGDRANGIKFL